MQNDMMHDLDFEQQIKDFTAEGRFLARQMYEQCKTCEAHDARITALEARDKKMFALSGAGGAGLVGIVMMIAEAIKNKWFSG